jgi:hypothetical protein
VGLRICNFNRTFRVRNGLSDGQDTPVFHLSQFEEQIWRLNKLGCSFEGMYRGQELVLLRFLWFVLPFDLSATEVYNANAFLLTAAMF